MSLCEARHRKWPGGGGSEWLSTSAVDVADSLKEPSSSPLDLVGLPEVMALTEGSPSVVIGLIDGPVADAVPGLGDSHRELGPDAPSCGRTPASACRHGTFVASMLVGERSSAAVGIAPNCTLISRPIFRDETGGEPSATVEEFAEAVVEAVDAGARILNMSASLVESSFLQTARLEAAFRHASSRGALSVVATGNQGLLGGSILASQPWIIPVVGCDLSGRPLKFSNLGHSIARRGLQAPATGVIGLMPDGSAALMGGTSVAAPFVTGTIALLWSLFPRATPADVTFAVCDPHRRRRLVPPVLQAGVAYRALKSLVERGHRD